MYGIPHVLSATSIEELDRYAGMEPKDIVALTAAKKDREDELERQGEQNP